MSDLHLDQEIRIDNQRCAAILIKDKKLLMMHRIKNGYEYYVFIGGHRRDGEEKVETLEREILEESSIKIKNVNLAFEFKDFLNNNYDFYYLCEWVSGIPELGGEEKIKNSKENFYKLEWIDIENFETLNILPSFAKYWVLDNFVEKLKTDSL